MEDHPEPSSSTLDVLESGSYLNPSSTSEIKNTLVKFSNSLNGTGRISLLTAGKEDCEEFISLLLTLKKNIKETLSELGRSRRKQVENYSCGECTQQIPIEIGNDFWSAFQSHEHLEELYVKFLSGIPIIEEEKVIQNEPTQSNFGDLGNTENIDSGIEHEVPANEDDHKSASGSEEEGGLNTFRFNFKLQYDPTVEAKLYPESILKAVRRIDKVPDFTIQRAGIIRGVCLLCSCDLISKSRISKNSILDHVMGQRHLKFSTNSTYLDALKAYHETFVNLEPEFQAHQVYFRPETHKSSKCILCNCMVKHFLMMDHIRLNQHKRMVLDMFKKKSTVYYLMDFQALAYGVTEDQNDGKQEENAEEKVAVKPKTPAKENTPVKNREKKDKDSIVSTDEPQHHIVKSIEDPISTNISAWVPHRYRDHMQFLKEKGNIILCEPCQVKLIRDAEVLKKHLKQSSHQKFCTKLVKYSFFCEICNAKFTDENTWSKHFTDGPNRHANMAESRKSKAAEYECTKCFMVIYGDELSLARHISDKSRRERRADKKEIKLPEKVRKLFESRETIEAEGQKMANEANDTLKYDQLTRDCCAKLEATLNVVFEQCKVYPFGSRISGLGNQYSDLDVFIDTGDMYKGEKNQDSLAQVQMVRKAAGTLSRYRDEFEDVYPVPTARTPIVKLYHKKTKIECDLSFRHGLSVENTKFLRCCIDIQPITQPFILLLKNGRKQ
ncbi:hypothetical protein JTB14_026168 [Gonioctena quinquepunctata]|nr:hypothetical protein JTB14_026168 [Gonioctena quinquepunctata]